LKFTMNVRAGICYSPVASSVQGINRVLDAVRWRGPLSIEGSRLRVYLDSSGVVVGP